MGHTKIDHGLDLHTGKACQSLYKRDCPLEGRKDPDFLGITRY